MKAFITLALLFVLACSYAANAFPSVELDPEVDEYKQNFMDCMGKDWAHQCTGDVLKCATSLRRKKCIDAIVCGGKSTHGCSHLY